MVNNLPANAGDAGSIPGSGNPLEEEMTTCSSILAWKNHMSRETWQDVVPAVAKELDMTEQPKHEHACDHPKTMCHSKATSGLIWHGYSFNCIFHPNPHININVQVHYPQLTNEKKRVN